MIFLFEIEAINFFYSASKSSNFSNIFFTLRNGFFHGFEYSEDPQFNTIIEDWDNYAEMKIEQASCFGIYARRNTTHIFLNFSKGSSVDISLLPIAPFITRLHYNENTPSLDVAEYMKILMQFCERMHITRIKTNTEVLNTLNSSLQ